MGGDVNSGTRKKQERRQQTSGEKQDDATFLSRCSLRLVELEVNLSLDSESILRRAGGRTRGGDGPRSTARQQYYVISGTHLSSQSRADVPRCSASDCGSRCGRPVRLSVEDRDSRGGEIVITEREKESEGETRSHTHVRTPW